MQYTNTNTNDVIMMMIIIIIIITVMFAMGTAASQAEFEANFDAFPAPPVMPLTKKGPT